MEEKDRSAPAEGYIEHEGPDPDNAPAEYAAEAPDAAPPPQEDVPSSQSAEDVPQTAEDVPPSFTVGAAPEASEDYGLELPEEPYEAPPPDSALSETEPFIPEPLPEPWAAPATELQEIPEEPDDMSAAVKRPPSRLAPSAPVKSPARKALGIAGATIFVLFLATLAFLVAIILTSRGDEGSALFGFSLYTVQSGSMEPAIPAGSVVVDRKLPADQIGVGDVITFTPLVRTVSQVDVNVTHRVVSAREPDPGIFEFVTRGDANDTNDPAITSDLVKGVVLFYIPLLGSLINFLRPPSLGLLLIVIPCFIIIVVELAKLISLAKESKTRKP